MITGVSGKVSEPGPPLNPGNNSFGKFSSPLDILRNDYYKINQYGGLRKVKRTPKMPWMLGKSA
jgi:hypothetical protein